MAARNIPNYRLYGEDSDQADVEFVHCESISQRSIVHNWNIQPHRHDTLYQLFCLNSGGGTMLLEGATLELPVPGLIMIPPMVVHGFRFQRDIKGAVVTINETGMDRILAAAPALLSDLSDPKIMCASDGGIDFDEVASLFRRIEEEFSGERAARLCALQSYLGLVFVQLARTVASKRQARLSVADKQIDQMRRFRDLIEERFREHRPVATYASELGITPTHLNRICRSLFGKSALTVIHDRLLLESKRNLTYTSMSVKEVAHLLGFSDPGYFARFFAKNTGLSPSEFRVASRHPTAPRAPRAVAA